MRVERFLSSIILASAIVFAASVEAAPIAYELSPLSSVGVTVRVETFANPGVEVDITDSFSFTPDFLNSTIVFDEAVPELVDLVISASGFVSLTAPVDAGIGPLTFVPIDLAALALTPGNVTTTLDTIFPGFMTTYDVVDPDASLSATIFGVPFPLPPIAITPEIGILTAGAVQVWLADVPIGEMPGVAVDLGGGFELATLRFELNLNYIYGDNGVPHMPEPHSAALMLIALGFVSQAARRRRS